MPRLRNLNDYEKTTSDSPLVCGKRYYLTFDQQHSVFSFQPWWIDDEAGARRRFAQAEQAAFNGRISSSIIAVRVTTERDLEYAKEIDYELLVEVGAEKCEIPYGFSAHEWCKEIAKAWSGLVPGAVAFFEAYAAKPDVIGILPGDLEGGFNATVDQAFVDPKVFAGAMPLWQMVVAQDNSSGKTVNYGDQEAQYKPDTSYRSVVRFQSGKSGDALKSQCASILVKFQDDLRAKNALAGAAFRLKRWSVETQTENPNYHLLTMEHLFDGVTMKGPAVQQSSSVSPVAVGTVALVILNVALIIAAVFVGVGLVVLLWAVFEFALTSIPVLIYVGIGILALWGLLKVLSSRPTGPPASSEPSWRER